jgi:hypothetical protein
MRVGFIESDKISLIFLLFIYIWGAKSALVQLFKYKSYSKTTTTTTNAPPRSHPCLTWLPTSVWKIILLVYFDLGWKVCLCWVVGFCVLLTGFSIQSSVSSPFYPSLTVPWKEFDSEMDGFEPPVTEASNRSTLCTKNVPLQGIFMKTSGKQTRTIPAMAPCSTYPRQNSERRHLVSVLLGVVTDPF